MFQNCTVVGFLDFSVNGRRFTAGNSKETKVFDAPEGERVKIVHAYGGTYLDSITFKLFPAVPPVPVPVPASADPIPGLFPTHWKLGVETIYLVFRFLNPAKDIRVAFKPGVYKDFGTTANHHYNEALTVLYSSGTWSIREETGVLVIRDGSSAADHRYAFHPGSGNINFGSGTEIFEFGGRTLYTGFRWTINVENGVLVFRDNLSSGDNRYAFFQNYLDI